jgi:hypothetical protein
LGKREREFLVGIAGRSLFGVGIGIESKKILSHAEERRFGGEFFLIYRFQKRTKVFLGEKGKNGENGK